MRRALGASLVALVVTTGGHAGADDPVAGANPSLPACLGAYEQAQVLRREAKLRAAREQLLLCVQDACPPVARQDCTTWLNEVEASLPSLSVSVVDAKGAPALDAAVSLDGAPVPDWSSGRAIGVDPGSHQIRATRGRGESAVATVLVVEGRRNQPVALELRPAAAAPVQRQVQPSDAGSSLTPWIFGGVAVLGLGGFAGFGIAALSQESHLDGTCKPDCTPDQIDEVRTLRIVSGVSLGVGVAAAVIAGLSLLLDDDDRPARHQQGASPSLRAAPWLEGGGDGIRLRF